MARVSGCVGPSAGLASLASLSRQEYVTGGDPLSSRCWCDSDQDAQVHLHLRLGPSVSFTQKGLPVCFYHNGSMLNLEGDLKTRYYMLTTMADRERGQMHRRHFLSRAGGTLSALYAGGGALLVPRQARAVEPGTVVTILQVVSSVVGLFRQSGPGLADLMALNTEMLKQMSAQLGAIQAGVSEILTRLDDLKTLIGEVPAQTVIELYKATIAGKESRYMELLKTYQADSASAGLEKARAAMLPELTAGVLTPAGTPATAS